MDWLEHLAATLSPAQLAEARRRESENGRGEDYLLDSGLSTPDRTLWAKAAALKLPHMTLLGYHPEPESLALITEEQARRLLMLPLFTLDGKLYVALTDPNNLDAVDFVRKKTGLRVESVLVLRSDLDRAFQIFYGGVPASSLTPPPPPVAAAPPPPPPPPAPTPPPVVVPVAPVTGAATAWEPLLAHAVALGASDVHLEPSRDRVSLRLRVDGQLEEQPPLSTQAYAPLLAHLESLNGRARWQLGDRTCEARVTLAPSLYGQAATLRLHVTALGELAGLGMDPRTSGRFETALKSPRGLIVIASPAAAGRSTTLHNVMLRLAAPTRKSVLLEHPIERDLPGVLEIDAFTSESALAQDPDVIAWGDLHQRAFDARQALTAASSRLVLVGVNAWDTPEALHRWLDLDIAQASLLRVLRGVLCQRLMRRLCSQCRQKLEAPPAADLQALGLRALPPGVSLFGPRGCPECRNTGYRGRVGIFEFLEVTPELRTSTLTPEALVKQAESAGFMSLRHAALGKLLSGHTSMEEVKASLPE